MSPDQETQKDSEEAQRQQALETLARLDQYMRTYRLRQILGAVFGVLAFAGTMYVLFQHQEWDLANYSIPIGLLIGGAVYLAVAFLGMKPMKP